MMHLHHGLEVSQSQLPLETVLKGWVGRLQTRAGSRARDDRNRADADASSPRETPRLGCDI